MLKFESFKNNNSFLDILNTNFKEYNSELYDELKMVYYIKNGKEIVVEFSLSSTIEYEIDDSMEIEGNKKIKPSGEYIPIHHIVVSDKYRNLGIATKVVLSVLEYSKILNVDGVIVTEFDYDTEFQRTKEGTGVWEKLLKTNSKVSKIMYEDDDEIISDFILSNK